MIEALQWIQLFVSTLLRLLKESQSVPNFLLMKAKAPTLYMLVYAANIQSVPRVL